MSLRRLVTTSLIALIAIYGSALAAAHIRAGMAERTTPPQGQFVSVDGKRVHYVEMGEGPDLVLVHGAFGSVRDFTFDIAERLAQDYRVIAFDRPGLGYSDPIYPGAFERTAESPGEQARILAGAAQRLGLRDPIVLGHSFGGIVSLAWALDHDPAAVVMVAGVAMPWPGNLGWTYQLNGTALGGGLLAPILTGFVPPFYLENGVAATFAPQTMPEGYDRHIGPYLPVRLPVFRSNTRQVNMLRPHVVEMEKRYPDLTLPIEIVHGSEDKTVPISIHSGPFDAIVDSANLTVIDGAGHMPHHTHTDDVIAAVHRAATRAGLR